MAVVLPPINPLGLETANQGPGFQPDGIILRKKSADRSPRRESEFQAMNRRDWVNSGLIIFGLLILAILVAQSRRNCEIPGSSWVPCIWGEPLKSNKGVVIYTLYRNSPTVGTISGDGARIHVATFDAAEDKDYNRDNCETARDLFASQSGVMVRYWCERGKFTQ